MLYSTHQFLTTWFTACREDSVHYLAGAATATGAGAGAATATGAGAATMTGAGAATATGAVAAAMATLASLTSAFASAVFARAA